MSFVKKMQTGVQWMKVRAGKAKVSEEDPEFKARMNVYDTDKVALKQCLHDFENEAEGLEARLTQLTKKTENLDRIAEYATERKYPYEVSVKALAQVDRAIEDTIRERLGKLRDLLLEPTRRLVKEHLATAHKLKQRYNETHLHLDAMNEKFAGAKDGEPKQKAQAAVDEAQQEYNQAKDAFLRALDVMEEFKETIFVKNMPEYREVSARFYRKMVEATEASIVSAPGAPGGPGSSTA